MSTFTLTLTRKELISHLLAVAGYWERQAKRGEAMIEQAKEAAGKAYDKIIDASNKQAIDKLNALAMESRVFAEKLSKPRWWESSTVKLTRAEAVAICYPIEMLLCQEVPAEFMEGSIAAAAAMVDKARKATAN